MICQIEDTTKDYQLSAHGRKTVRIIDEIVLPNSNTVSAAEFIRRVSEYPDFPDPESGSPSMEMPADIVKPLKRRERTMNSSMRSSGATPSS